MGGEGGGGQMGNTGCGEFVLHFADCRGNIEATYHRRGVITDKNVMDGGPKRPSYDSCKRRRPRLIRQNGRRIKEGRSRN